MTDRSALAPPMRTALARVLLGAFVVVHVLLALGPSPTPWVQTVVALVLISGAAALLVLDRPRPIDRVRSAAVVTLTITGTGLIVVPLPADGWPGYASWPLGAATFITVGLTMRGRIGVAWIAMGLLAGICVLWSSLGGAGVLSGIGLIDRQAGTLLIGTLFAIGLRRAERSVEAFHELERQRSLERDTTGAELQARRDAVQRVLGTAGTTLRRIAGGHDLDEEERLRALSLEGRLRDEIALAPLLSESLDTAMDAARRRGVDVVVLSDPNLGDLPTATRMRAADWLAARLNRTAGAEFVGRALTREGQVRVSANTGEGTENRLLSDHD